jgi:hypothetical protein
VSSIVIGMNSFVEYGFDVRRNCLLCVRCSERYEYYESDLLVGVVVV